MNFNKLIFFSESFRKLLPKIRFLLSVAGRALSICLKQKRKLLIEDLQVNHSFLLTNSLISINWQLKNFLWIRINNVITTTNANGIILQLSKLETPITIVFWGFFCKTKRQILIEPTAKIQNIQEPSLNIEQFKVNEIKSKMYLDPYFFNIPSNSKSLAITIKPLNIQLPVFTKDYDYE